MGREIGANIKGPAGTGLYRFALLGIREGDYEVLYWCLERSGVQGGLPTVGTARVEMWCKPLRFFAIAQNDSLASWM